MTFHHTITDHPLENEYPKLVRDKIPQIIKQNDGIDVPTRLLDDREFLAYLLKKIAEEVEELSQANTDANIKEELADVYEVLDELIKLKGFSASDITLLQTEKREKRCGFERRLLMLGKEPANKSS